MANLQMLLLVFACKASLILAIVAVLAVSCGRRWPVGCTLWQRMGVVALLILPAAVCFVPAIQIPILAPAKRALPVDDGILRSGK